ncbi:MULTISPECIES: hypothetical protein, partial [Comamonas]|uniref:hypothetical protein n=1 Tax=Comamonas TaxID=283 RepID=UPI00237D41CD
RHWVYLKMGLPDAYIEVTTLAINKLPTPVHSLCLMHLIPKTNPTASLEVRGFVAVRAWR